MYTATLSVDAKGVVINSEAYNVYDVTGALKQFFRSLPDPLLTHQLYGSFIAAAGISYICIYQPSSLITYVQIHCF